MEPDDLLRQGRALLAAGRLDEALAAYNDLLRTDPLMPAGYEGRARIMAARGEHAEALMGFAFGLQMAVNDGTYGRMGLAGLWFGKADALAALERREEALAAYDTGLAMDPAHGGAIAGRGAVLIALGRTDEALAAYEAAVAAEPEALAVWFAKGEAEYDLGRKDAARKSFTRFAAIVRANGAGEAKALVPRAAARLKELLGPGTGSLAAPAQAAPTQAAPSTGPLPASTGPLPAPGAQPTPGQWQRLVDEARALYMAGKFEEAERTLRGAVAVAPPDQRGKLLHNLGQILEYAGKLKEALDAYLAAAKADPRQVHTWAQLGVMFMKGRQPAYAVEALKRALALKPDHAQAWHLQSQALALMGRVAEARAAGERALGFAPADEAIKAHVARLRA